MFLNGKFDPMGNLEKPALKDPESESRKKDHIDLAFESKILSGQIDNRFYYEPALASNDITEQDISISFAGKQLSAPLWVSSMTGGTKWAKTINHNLAKACNEFGLGMGLGSCRPLLYSNEFIADFSVRNIIGTSLPLFANIGIAQIEELIEEAQLNRLTELMEKLEADGLIIHINPLQEWLQPEGDLIKQPPVETIKSVLDKLPNIKIIVKEVGQGMGINSLMALLQLPIQAIEFGANGGTNFAKLEMSRSDNFHREQYGPLAMLGHSAEEMVQMINSCIERLGHKILCKEIIVSGGIKHFLDGYHLINKLEMPAIYGQASAFLKYARDDYESLRNFVDAQIKGLKLAQAYLKIK